MGEDLEKAVEEAYQHGLKRALEATVLRCLAYKNVDRVLNETKDDLQALTPTKTDKTTGND